MANAFDIYKNNSVAHASPQQLLLMLVDGADKFAKRGRQAIIDKDIATANDSLIRVQNIFGELMATLDRTAGDWAEKLFLLYAYIKDRVFQANIKKDAAIMDEVIPLIEDVKDTWHQASEKIS